MHLSFINNRHSRASLLECMGFPSDRAAEIALDTARKWLTENLDKVPVAHSTVIFMNIALLFLIDG